MANKNQDLLLLLERPKEPIFVPKGDREAIFEVPNNFLEDRFKPIGPQIFNRFGEQTKERIPVNDVTAPVLTEPLGLTRYENFSLFIPKHRKASGKLIEIFMGAKDVEELKSLAAYCRDRVNPYLFNYALSVALLHRGDTRNIDLPSFISSFPDKFVDGTTLQRAREEANIVPDGSRMPIVIPRDYTASDLEPEHRLAYFREDLGINLHHWHWHLVYPFEGPMNVVNKDRRGELFYFMHQQMQARYNFERLCNKMARVKRWLDWRKPIPEAYFPKLNSLVAGRAYPARVENSLLANMNRESDQAKLDIADLERWRDRIFEAIHAGAIKLPNGTTQELDEFTGVDLIGNIFEASILSPNRNYYGDLHNMLHTFLSVLHDPDGRHLESFSPIGDPSTTMRDPMFFRLHEFVDDVFQELKQTLPSYTAPQLDYRGITVTNVEIDVQGGRKNQLQTFWQQSDVDLSRGLDFTPRGSVFVRFTHLQHTPFTYTITVNNTTNAQRMGTCRIFMAPKFDERGTRWLLRDQRLMFIEMDKFTVTLKAGENRIVRRSDQSTVTIPFERTFRDLDTNRPTDQDALEQFNYCGCGWPQHMLVPKGVMGGFECELFVMISNYDDDRVEQNVSGRCSDAFSFCGIKDRKYPDRRPMGFPFDRVPSADTLQQFLLPNMRVQDVTINFSERTVQGPRPRPPQK